MNGEVEAATEASSACSSAVLYITYDGLTDPLGGSQVLPYLVGLARLGHRITILSFEKPERRGDQDSVRAICRRSGIEWHPLAYHKRPPILSTALDYAMMKRAAARLHRRQRFDIVHCRSYVPALAGLHLKRRSGVRFLFDMRGFWADERIDGRLWNLSNPLFRLLYGRVKRLEARMLAAADHVVSLTDAGKRELLRWPALDGDSDKITIIPCCVDFEHFRLPGPSDRSNARAELGIAPDAPVAAYLGSVGSWYMLDEMLDFFRCYRQRHPGARFLFLTREPAEDILRAAEGKGLDPGAFVIRPASRDEVPRLLAAADLGIFFIKPAYSKIASSPTKMGEMLALGLPVVTNGNVGDVAEIVAATGSGAIVDRFTPAAYEAAIESVESGAPQPEEIRARALPWFDAEIGIARYHRIYCRLAEGGRASPPRPTPLPNIRVQQAS